MTATVEVDVTGDGVAVLTLADEKRRNAIGIQMADTLVSAVADVISGGVGAVVVTGRAPAFCAGGDLAALASADDVTLARLYRGFLAVANCPVPTIAAVNGPAIGAGLNLALACDLRLAGPTAFFDARFLSLGVHPGGGYGWMVHRAGVEQFAAATTLFGQSADAHEAERIGLVWSTYPDDDTLLSEALRLAGNAARARPDLVRATKANLRRSSRTTTHEDAVAMELPLQAAFLRNGLPGR